MSETYELKAEAREDVGRRQTDQRALHIVKNVRSKELREKLEEASDNAARQAVAEATAEADVRVMFLIDKSGSMEGAIEQSKEALARILAGFPVDKLHIASFDTVGTVLKPKASSRTAVMPVSLVRALTVYFSGVGFFPLARIDLSGCTASIAPRPLGLTGSSTVQTVPSRYVFSHSANREGNCFS